MQPKGMYRTFPEEGVRVMLGSPLSHFTEICLGAVPCSLPRKKYLFTGSTKEPGWRGWAGSPSVLILCLDC